MIIINYVLCMYIQDYLCIMYVYTRLFMYYVCTYIRELNFDYIYKRFFYKSLY